MAERSKKQDKDKKDEIAEMQKKLNKANGNRLSPFIIEEMMNMKSAKFQWNIKMAGKQFQ